MRRSTAFALLAIVLTSTFVRLGPLLRSLYWGADIGEYFALLQALVARGVMPTRYLGWGITYPVFPGMFLAQSPLVEIGAVPLPAVLSLLVPTFGALAVLPVFLLTANVVGDDRAGLFAAALVAGAMPVAYTASHTAPATLADLLAITALVLFLRLGRDARALLPLGLASAALVPTHHLSAYFLILMVVGTTVLRGLIRPVPWPGLRREVGYEAFLLVITFGFWFGYAGPFRDSILHVVNFRPWWLLLAAFPLLLAILAGLVVARRRMPWRYRPGTRGPRYGWTAYGLAVAFVFGLAGFATLASIPGTAVTLSPATVVAFAPFLLLLAFAAAGRSRLDFRPGGLAVASWFASLGASALLGTVVATQILIPYRHVEYLVLPLAVFAGAGVVWLARAAGTTPRRRAAAVALTVVLLAGTFVTAIPPPSFLGGWDEGVPAEALRGAYWVRGRLDGLIAADHEASSILFGFGGMDATWDNTASPFFSADFATARPGLVHVLTPSGIRNVSYVWIDRRLAAGVQLKPWDPASAMPSASREKFDAEPFVKVYDDGFGQVYWIDWGLAP